jgi:hypothetical protein
MPTPEVFYLHLCGEQRGPYTIPQIDHLLNSGLIAEETLFWREGLEQWQPITDLVAKRKVPNRWRHAAIALAILTPLAVLAWIFGPTFLEAWNEATATTFTLEDAYWHARDLVRHEALPPGGLVRFEKFASAGVELMKDDAANVQLRGQLSLPKVAPRTVAWRVHLQYDRTKGEWTNGVVQEDSRLE